MGHLVLGYRPWLISYRLELPMLTTNGLLGAKGEAWPSPDCEGVVDEDGLFAHLWIVSP